MGLRHPNFRLLKHHRPYTTEELAIALHVHKNTIRRWVTAGLQPIDEKRPMMFRGIDVFHFLKKRKAAGKRKCAPGEIYCFKCREPRAPDGQFADLKVTSPTNGCLIGICGTCNRMLYRRVNPARLDGVRGNLEIAIRKHTDA